MSSTKALQINEFITYHDITPGGVICGGGTSTAFYTGDWRTVTPVFKGEKCKHCLLCFPVCPDSAIPVEGKKRLDFDYEHCKGCGICAQICPFGAISFCKESK